MSTLAGPFTVNLPIADRWRAMLFYRDAFGFTPIGGPTEDGVPEPLQFRLDDRVLLMLIPAGGFGWVVGEGRELAPLGTSECLLSMAVPTEADVVEVMARVRAAGGEVTTEPGHYSWGYSGVCADPDGHLWQITVAP